MRNHFLHLIQLSVILLITSFAFSSSDEKQQNTNTSQQVQQERELEMVQILQEVNAKMQVLLIDSLAPEYRVKTYFDSASIQASYYEFGDSIPMETRQYIVDSMNIADSSFWYPKFINFKNNVNVEQSDTLTLYKFKEIDE